MRRVKCALVFAICAMTAQSAMAQTFDVRRESVLATDMRVEPVTPPRNLTAVEVQLPVAPSGAAAVRLHLQIVRADAGTPWVVTISDSQGTVVQRIDDRSPFVSLGGIWTDDVQGASARVSIAADAAKVQIAVDRVAIAVTPSVPQGIVGKNELTPIIDAGVPAKVKQWAPAIAKLRFMVADDEALCTGFLVGVDLLMTNQHCVTTDEEAQSAVVEFGFDSDAATPARLHVVKVEATDFSLDYSLLRLSAAPPSQFVRLHFGAAPGANALLAIVQHPGGQPKQVSFVPNCAAGSLAVAGREQADSDFGHVCDTLGGSSGSPVLDWSTGRVVGLHHLGFRPGIDKPENQAVHVSLILADIESKVSDAIYQEIIR